MYDPIDRIVKRPCTNPSTVMLDTRARRVVAVALLVGALLGLAVEFGTVQPDPRLGYYPTGDHLAADHDGYVGESARVRGTVERVDPVVVLAVPYEFWADGEYRTGTTRLRVRGVSEPVSPGQELQVYGTVEADRTIRAVDSVVVPAGNQLYMYGVSLLAGLWVLARLVRGWTVAWTEFAIRRRSRPISVVETVRRRLRTGEPADA